MNYKISIILNGYNGEKYLNEQIDSILKQSYRNFELILYDDCSTDSTYKIFQNYQKKDKRIRVFKNEKNLGLVNSCNIGLSKATGDFITLADNDNKWKKNRLKIMMDFFEKNPKYDLVFHDSYVCDDKLKIINNSFEKKIRGSIFSFNHINTRDHSFANLLNHDNHIPGIAILFKSKFLKYIIPIPTVSMHDIWIGLIISSMGNIGYIDQPLAYYRQHSNNMVGASIDSNTTIIKNLSHESFIGNYIKNKEKYLIMLNQLKEVIKSNTKKQRIVAQRINVIKDTIRLAKSTKTISKDSVTLIKSVFRNQNYPHLKYAIYLIAYKLLNRSNV